MAFAEAARSLAARGFRVHPLRAGSKVALVEGWPDKATTDPAQIDAWWSKWSEANVGIATGLGVMVVDLDGEDGVSSWTELTKDAEAPPTMAVRTPRGWHLYFAADNVSNSANRLGQHVDVRGDGGYVVGPGSVVDGKEYIEHEAAIAAAPSWLVSMARGEFGTSPENKLPRPNYEPAETYGEGERNDGLFRLASSLRARGLTESELLAALVAANQERCTPPLDDSEVRLIASSASRFERGETPAVIIHKGADIHSGSEQRPNCENGSTGEIVLVPASDVQPESVEWLWDGRIPIGMVTLLVGQGGQGKSMMTHYIAAGLTRGLIPGAFHGEPATVVIASAEDHRASTIVPRLMLSGADMSRALFIEYRGGDGTIDDIELDGRIQEIEAALSGSNARALIVDTVVAHIPQSNDTYKEQHVRRVLKPLAHMAERIGIAVIGVMHLNRREARDVLTRISGSGGFGNLARSVLMFAVDPSAEPDDPTRYLAHGKCNVGPKAPTLRLRIESGMVRGEDGRSIVTARLIVEGEDDRTPAELLQPEGEEGESAPARTEAEDFLRQELAGGAVASKKVLADAKELGINPKTMYRAKKRLGIVSEEGANGWMMALPSEGSAPVPF